MCYLAPQSTPKAAPLTAGKQWQCVCVCEGWAGGRGQVRTWWQPLIHLNAILNLNESLWLFICIVREPTAAAATSVLLVPACQALFGRRGRGREHGGEALSNSCCWKTLFLPGTSPKYVVSAAASDEVAAYGSISH